MPRYQGRSYSLAGSPEEWLADDDGSPAPPEAATALYERSVRKGMRQLGWKVGGRPPEGDIAMEYIDGQIAAGRTLNLDLVKEAAKESLVSVKTVQRWLKKRGRSWT
jgi:hypothetical protein